MKKYLLLIILAIFALSGCGSEVNTDKEQEDPKSKTVANDGDESDSSDVELTIPAEFFEGQSEDDVIASFEEEGIDNITLNDDGSYTLKMSKEEHEVMLNDLREEIDEDIEAIIGSMDIEFIKGASMNDTVTELTVVIDQSMYDGDMEGLVLMDFAFHAMPYQVMNGVTEEDFDFEVVLVDSETGEEFERTSVHDE